MTTDELIAALGDGGAQHLAMQERAAFEAATAQQEAARARREAHGLGSGGSAQPAPPARGQARAGLASRPDLS